MSTRIFSSVFRKTLPSGATITRQAQKVLKLPEYSGARAALTDDLFQSIKDQGSKAKYGMDSASKTPYLRITDKAGVKQERIYLTQGAEGTDAEKQTRLAIKKSVQGIQQAHDEKAASRLYRELRAQPTKKGKPGKPLNQKQAQRELARDTAFQRHQEQTLNSWNGSSDQAAALSKAQRDSETLARVDRTHRNQRVLEYNQGMTEQQALERAIRESKSQSSDPRPPVVRERRSIPTLQPEPLVERPSLRRTSLSRHNSLTRDENSTTAFRLGESTSPPRPTKDKTLSDQALETELETSSLSQPSALATAYKQDWSFNNVPLRSTSPSIADSNPYQDWEPAFMTHSPLASPFGTIKRPRSSQANHHEFSSAAFPERQTSLRDLNPQFSQSDSAFVSPMPSMRRPKQSQTLFSPISPSSYRAFDNESIIHRSSSPTISDYAPTPRSESPALARVVTKNTSYSHFDSPFSGSRKDLAQEIDRTQNNASPTSTVSDTEYSPAWREEALRRLEALRS